MNDQQLSMDEASAPIDFFEPDAVQRDVSPEDALELLTALAAEYVALNDEIVADTQALGEKSAKFNRIARVRIPEIMEGLKMAEFKLLDGSKVELKNIVNASISEDRKVAAHNWLREHNFDGIIKTNLSASFGKGESEEAAKARKLLEDAGFFPNTVEAVHPATLKSFVKEQLEAGTAIPQDTFGVFEFKEAKISLPKTKKPRKK